MQLYLHHRSRVAGPTNSSCRAENNSYLLTLIELLDTHIILNWLVFTNIGQMILEGDKTIVNLWTSAGLFHYYPLSFRLKQASKNAPVSLIVSKLCVGWIKQKIKQLKSFFFRTNLESQALNEDLGRFSCSQWGYETRLNFWLWYMTRFWFSCNMSSKSFRVVTTVRLTLYCRTFGIGCSRPILEYHFLWNLPQVHTYMSRKEWFLLSG